VLADEEREVLFQGEIEVLVQHGFQPVASGALRPVATRGELFQPGAGRGEQELATWFYQIRQSLNQELGISQSAEEIRRMDEIEAAEISAQMHGVALLELHSLAWRIGGYFCDEFRHRGSFIEPLIGQLACDQRLRGIDKAVAVIHAEDTLAELGQFEARPTYSAAEIERGGWLQSEVS
jgi:hypothetical protein